MVHSLGAPVSYKEADAVAKALARRLGDAAWLEGVGVEPEPGRAGRGKPSTGFVVTVRVARGASRRVASAQQGLTSRQKRVPVRVVERSRARKGNPVCDPEQITKNLVSMRAILQKLAPQVRRLENARSVSPNDVTAWAELGDARVATSVAFAELSRSNAAVLFQGILQQYELPPRLRSQIEAASRFYMRRRRLAAGPVAKMLKEAHAYFAHFNAAEEAVRVGKPHAACSVDSAREVKAGPFRLINTGGFDRATMESVKKIVEEAARRLKAHGLGQVLYGDISISNTVSRANVLAFYYNAHDDMFVRANVKGFEKEAVRTVMHELAHRYHHKVLNDDSALATLYREVGREERAAQRDAIDELPKVGELFEARNGKYEVIGTVPVRGGVRVRLKKLSSNRFGELPGPEQFASIPLAAYMQHKGTPRKGGYVTPYARKGGPKENFAEMVAFYGLDQLPASQVVMLKKLLARHPAGAESPPAASVKPAKQASVVEEARALVTALGYEEAEKFALGQAAQDPGGRWMAVLTSLFDLKRKRP